MSTLIHHHMGLGDHIICNGLVRELRSSIKGKLTLACKQHNLPTVKDMYSDLDINYLIGNDSDIERDYGTFTKVHRVGFEKLDYGNGIPIEIQFYMMENIDPETKYKL